MICEKCSEFGIEVSEDGRITYLWGEKEDKQYLSLEMSLVSIAKLIIEKQSVNKTGE